MIKKYIKGSSTNPEGVIKALENLGSVNERNMSGTHENCIYYINRFNYIDCVSMGTEFAIIIMECFEEIQPIESAPKVITNLDVVKWYFKMRFEGHAIQFKDQHDFIRLAPLAYHYDDAETEVVEVSIDFGEWIPIEEARILTDKETSSDDMNKIIASLKSK